MSQISCYDKYITFYTCIEPIYRRLSFRNIPLSRLPINKSYSFIYKNPRNKSVFKIRIPVHSYPRFMYGCLLVFVQVVCLRLLSKHTFVVAVCYGLLARAI